MVDEPLISVIVPVYNVCDYLEECVTSIIKQTYSNLEVLLVDDGSTDGSDQLCDQLAARDSRVTAFHKNNGGLSDARNYGLSKSVGEWVSFIDSDDFVSPVFIESLLLAAMECGCDISAVPFGNPFVDNEGCELINSLALVPAAEPIDTYSIQSLLLYQRLDTGAPWRLYKKELLGVDPFPVGMYYEDLACVYKIIRKVEHVALLDCRELYAYRMRSGSIMRQEYRHIKAKSALQIADHLYKDIAEWYPALAPAASSRCFSLCRMVFAQIPAFRSHDLTIEKDRRELWEVLKKHRRIVLFDHRARKRERMAAFVALFGMEAFSLFGIACRKIGLMR